MGRYKRPLFRATSLGEKYPTVDFIVDVLGREDVSLGFFFAQVKGTAAGLAPQARLPVEISPDRFNRLVHLPAPTFVIGVDVIAETSYLVAAYKTRSARVSSIAKTYCLQDEGVKIKLYREVLDFWKSNRPSFRWTNFKDV